MLRTGTVSNRLEREMEAALWALLQFVMVASDTLAPLAYFFLDVPLSGL